MKNYYRLMLGRKSAYALECFSGGFMVGRAARSLATLARSTSTRAMSASTSEGPARPGPPATAGATMAKRVMMDVVWVSLACSRLPSGRRLSGAC